MKCGCGYELFWRLNPAKLESFYESYRMKIKEKVLMQDNFAWLQGVYVRDAVLSIIGKASYPRSPKGIEQDNDFYVNQNQNTESDSPRRMTDGQKFALFMVKHNKEIQKKAKIQHNA